MSNKTTTKKSYLKDDEQDESQLAHHRISDIKAFFSLLYFARPYRLSISFALFLLVLGSACSLLSARFLGALVQEGLLAKNMSSSILYASIVLFLELLCLVLLWRGRVILCQKASLVILSIRQNLFTHLGQLPLSFFDRQPQGRIITRLTHDVEGLDEFFTSSLGRFASASFMVFLAAAAMISTHLKLGAILILSMLPVTLFIYLTRNKVRHVNRQMSKNSSSLNAKLSEYINGLEVIRNFGLEDWSKRNYDHVADRLLISKLKANFLMAWTQPLTSLLCALPLVGLIWFGGHSVLGGTLGIGLFVAFIRYCDRFYHPFLTLSREIHVIQQAFTSAERVYSFLQHQTEEKVLGHDGAIKQGQINGEIEFKDVWMAYQKEEWVLKGINFTILAGQKVGLIGKTGCGKTTTVSLLSRLYDFNRGEISIDSRPIRHFQRAFLRQKIGFISQDVVAFKGSIRENLRPDDSFSDEQILKCCQQTGFAQVMRRNDLTLDGQVLEGGSNLSIGEKQLLALTRILLRNPSILIMDEATANIDPYYEKLIHQAVDTIMKGRTCLIIAHRLETLKSCDQLLVFEQGKLVEKGTQEELFSLKGHFFNLQKAKERGQVDAF